MHTALQINHFSKHLFWDVDRATLDMDTNSSYIIKQVLEYGLMNDWSLLQQYYGMTLIAREAVKYRDLDKKAMTFIAFLSQTPIHEFRCYNQQQSTPQHWNF